jgi:insertion element IS1 protein InsB
MIVRAACPAWGSTRFTKNGPTHHGNQPHQGQTCPRPLVQGAEPYRISEETRALIARVLVARMAWRGLGRAVGVGLQGLVGVLVHGLEALPAHLHVAPVPCPPHGLMPRLEVEAAALRRFVQQKANQQWSGMAMDATPRHVMAFYLGARRRRRAKRLWAKIPHVDRQPATFDTEPSVVYEGGIPAAQHQASSTRARHANHLERFNHPVRQRVSRLGRETCSCSKKLAHHMGAITYCMCHDNRTRATA